MNGVDAFRVIEAAYDLEATREQWLRNVALAARPDIDGGRGVMAVYFDMTREPTHWLEPTLVLDGDQRLGDSASRLYAMLPIAYRRRLLSGAFPISSASRLMTRGKPLVPVLEWLQAEFAIHETVAICAADIAGAGCLVGAPHGSAQRLAPAAVRRWRRLCAHLAAGLRLRRALAQFSSEVGGRVEAVLDASGRVVHAEDAAKPAQLRALLRRAAQLRDASRSSLAQNSSQALEVWPALVSGRWTLIDRFEADGKRFTLALENEPRAKPMGGLSSGESAVARLAARGDSTKLIAYALGIAEGTAFALLARAIHKLGMKNRAELAFWVNTWSDPSLEASDLQVGGAPLLVLSAPSPERASFPSLSELDRQVMRAIARGESNADIARQLGCAKSTVANRIARLFARLGVKSRTELAKRVAAFSDPCPT